MSWPIHPSSLSLPFSQIKPTHTHTFGLSPSPSSPNPSPSSCLISFFFLPSLASPSSTSPSSSLPSFSSRLSSGGRRARTAMKGSVRRRDSKVRPFFFVVVGSSSYFPLQLRFPHSSSSFPFDLRQYRRFPASSSSSPVADDGERWVVTFLLVVQVLSLFPTSFSSLSSPCWLLLRSAT